MGFEADVECVEENDRVLLNINGKESGFLVGKKGETLDALQYLLNKMVHQEDADRKPIVVDCGGYRQRRMDALVQLAHRLADKAIQHGKIVAMNPMSAHDRLIIHLTLKETPGVSTHSEGEGIYRRLLIIPDPKSSA